MLLQGVFPLLISAILSTATNQTKVAHILELCTCHSEGIAILELSLDRVVECCDVFLKVENDLAALKYSAATVLLDLSANARCIERVGQLIMQRNMFKNIKQELALAFSRIISIDAADRVMLLRFRDLMIGIVLNVACNVDDMRVTHYMLD